MRASRKKGIMDVYPYFSFYITIASLGKIDVHMVKHLNVGAAANAPVWTVHIKNERYMYLFETHAKHSHS